MKKLFLLLLLISAGIPLARASAEPIKNAGFVPANIWYSKESFFAGEKVHIYTVIFNGSTNDLTGSVEFLDNDVLLGKTQFPLLTTGNAEDVSIPWKATEGKHTITARITDASTSSHGGSKTPIVLENANTGVSNITVEVDPALAKASAENTVALGAQVAGQVGGAIQAVNNAIPEPVKEGTTASVNAVESFRTTLEKELRAAKEDRGKKLDLLNARSATTTTSIEKANQKAGLVSVVSGYAEKPFTYVLYAVLAVLQYFFKWWIVFYGVVLYGVYRIAKWGIGKIRNR